MLAFDGLFGVNKKGRKSVDWYKEELSKMDEKILFSFSTAYTTLLLVMGNDGVPRVVIEKKE